MKNIALATVTTPNFLPGTLVMLHSFLTHNPWFNNNIYIIHDEIEEAQKKLISAIYPVHFLKVSSDIKEQIKKIIPDYTDFERRKAQFYSIELFGIENNESILFLDSDMLVKNNIIEIHDWGTPFNASGTVNKYKKEALNPEINPFDIEAFNAGFMLIECSLRNKKILNELKHLISQNFFKKFIEYAQMNNIPRVGSDQIIFNTYFKEVTTFISGKYNYRTGISKEILDIDNITLENASIIHYTGSKKPWMMDKILYQLTKDTPTSAIIIQWQEAWLKTLIHLKTNL